MKIDWNPGVSGLSNLHDNMEVWVTTNDGNVCRWSVSEARSLRGKLVAWAFVEYEMPEPYTPIPDVSWWPEWLTCEWVAMDADGDWWGYEAEPKKCVDKYLSDEGYSFVFRKSLFNIPFPGVPWKQSKFRNPHLEAEQ